MVPGNMLHQTNMATEGVPGNIAPGVAVPTPISGEAASSMPGAGLKKNEESKHSEAKEEHESDEDFSDDPKSRTSASSRVNFSKLTAEEKERRCHNMSKEVKQLRRKIRNMEERLSRNSQGMGSSQ